jgi:hypothetical protein
LKYKTKSIKIKKQIDEKRAITPRWVIKVTSKLQTDTILRGTHPGTIPVRFGFIWFSGFRGEV